MDKALWVFLGGGVGSVLRYALGLLVGNLTPQGAETPHWLAMYPIATLGANLIGCGLIGVAWGLIDPSNEAHNPMRLLLIVGVLGGFTTFSSFGWETLDLIQTNRAGTAIAYVLISVVVGLFAAWSGYAAAQSFVPGGN